MAASFYARSEGASDDGSGIDWLTRRLAADLRTAVRGIELIAPADVDAWAEMTARLSRVASIVEQERKLAELGPGTGGSAPAAPASPGRASDGTLWEGKEWALRYVLEDAKLNLIVRLTDAHVGLLLAKRYAAAHTGGCVKAADGELPGEDSGASAGPSGVLSLVSTDTATRFEAAVAVLLAAAWGRKEAVQTTDVPLAARMLSAAMLAATEWGRDSAAGTPALAPAPSPTLLALCLKCVAALCAPTTLAFIGEGRAVQELVVNAPFGALLPPFLLSAARLVLPPPAVAAGTAGAAPREEYASLRGALEEACAGAAALLGTEEFATHGRAALAAGGQALVGELMQERAAAAAAASPAGSAAADSSAFSAVGGAGALAPSHVAACAALKPVLMERMLGEGRLVGWGGGAAGGAVAIGAGSAGVALGSSLSLSRGPAAGAACGGALAAALKGSSVALGSAGLGSRLPTPGVGGGALAAARGKAPGAAASGAAAVGGTCTDAFLALRRRLRPLLDYCELAGARR